MATDDARGPVLFSRSEAVDALRKDAEGPKAAIWERVLASAERALTRPTPPSDLCPSRHSHFERDAEVRGSAVITTNDPAKLTTDVPASAPVDIAIERDHPVPFVSLTTRSAQDARSLRLHCEIARVTEGA